MLTLPQASSRLRKRRSKLKKLKDQLKSPQMKPKMLTRQKKSSRKLELASSQRTKKSSSKI